jgi:hypothetical protein
MERPEEWGEWKDDGPQSLYKYEWKTSSMPLVHQVDTDIKTTCFSAADLGVKT